MRKYNLDDNYKTLDENLIVNYIIIPGKIRKIKFKIVYNNISNIGDIHTLGSSLCSNSA